MIYFASVVDLFASTLLCKEEIVFMRNCVNVKELIIHSSECNELLSRIRRKPKVLFVENN